MKTGVDSPTYSRTLEQVGDLPAGSELVLLAGTTVSLAFPLLLIFTPLSYRIYFS